MSEPTGTVAPEQPQPKLDGRRLALFAAAGERIYLIEKMQDEVAGIRAELDKEQPTYPPMIKIDAVKAPEPEPAPAPEAQKETPSPTE
jgi:hypothetical protein